jgi:hypothetical protein
MKKYLEYAKHVTNDKYIIAWVKVTLSNYLELRIKINKDCAKQVGGVVSEIISGTNSLIVTGENSRIKAQKNTLVIGYKYDEKGNISTYKVMQIDGKKIKEDTWYMYKNGEFVEE